MAKKSVSSSKYWAKRSLERTTEAERASIPYLKAIQQVYRGAAQDLTENIKEVYAAYYGSEKKAFDIATLQSIAPTGSLRKLKNEMVRLGLETRLPDNYRGRLNRLQLLNLQAWAEVKKADLREQQISHTMYSKTVEDAYYRTIFDTAKRLDEIPAFTTLDSRTVNKVLETKFYGKNYSERIWTSTDRLADELQEIISRAVATGQPQEVTIRLLQERFGVKASDAARLARTEINYFQNRGEIESYAEMGIQKFKFLATLDEHTSSICREMDGKVFLIKEAKQGTNAPPLHPYCRSTITPYLGKENEPKQRIARDPATNQNYYVQGNMNYESWHKSLVENVAKKIDRRIPITGVTKTGMVTTGIGVNFDAPRLTKVDGDLLRDTVNSAEHLLEIFPNVREWVEEQGGLLITGMNHTGGTIASTLRAKPIISLNVKYYSSAKKLMNIVFKKSKSKWFMPTSTYKGYTFIHEFGHLVENYLLRSHNTDVAANRIKNAIIDIAMQQSNLSAKKAASLLSRYGTKNSREFFAETFANAFSGKPNALGKAMKIYLKEEMQK